jgi:MFS transporter, PAT family, solute carrier family 33 (acetyl-CoA transportor), member 1
MRISSSPSEHKLSVPGDRAHPPSFDRELDFSQASVSPTSTNLSQAPEVTNIHRASYTATGTTPAIWAEHIAVAASTLRNRNLSTHSSSSSGSRNISGPSSSSSEAGKGEMNVDMEIGDKSGSIITSSVASSSSSGKGQAQGHHSIFALPLQEQFSMVLLLVLYTLQGIPMGLSSSIPLILKERGASYSALGLYSMVSLPFSLKLLWAPFVDSVYISKIGRRKTWLIPVQLITGIVMVWYSSDIGQWLGGSDRGSGLQTGVEGSEEQGPRILELTIFFGSLFLLMATQDVAVDGWALTMLSRENVGYASTCNTIGQSFGFFIANQGFIALSDSTWCHRFLGTPLGHSIVTLESFMTIAGSIFIIVTLLVILFKKETPLSKNQEPEGLVVTYTHMASLIRLKPVQSLALILLTFKLAFSPADSVAMLKMQEYGMPKADIATFSPVILMVGLFLPAIVSKWVSHDPISAILYGIPLKLLTTTLMWGVLLLVQEEYSNPNEIIQVELVTDTDITMHKHKPSMLFFFILLTVSVLHEIADKLIFSAFMSFFAKISDPSIGGTYMTFLNTISNLGYRWASSLTIYTAGSLDYSNWADGYTLLTIFSVGYGLVWIKLMYPSLKALEHVPIREWWVSRIGIEDRDK